VIGWPEASEARRAKRVQGPVRRRWTLLLTFLFACSQCSAAGAARRLYNTAVAANRARQERALSAGD
jgi:hypothetical protein